MAQTMTMKSILVIRNHYDDNLYDTLIEFGWLLEPRTLQNFSEPQFEAIPNPFRCYICQEKHPRRDIGGRELGQYICRFCWPWITEADTGGLIRFDKAHSLPVEGYGASKGLSGHEDVKAHTRIAGKGFGGY